MHRNRIRISFPLVVALIVSFETPLLLAQGARINAPINGGRRIRLTGDIHPKATAANDQGPADASLVLPSITLVLKQSPPQHAELESLLAEQQDPSSRNYHRWLTPEEFADRFGASAGDIGKIAAWLEQQGLHVTGVGRGRNWISASGTAADVEKAFGTSIHRYRVNGREHFSNAAPPSIPEALAAVVKTIHGLNNFRFKPKSVLRRTRASEPARPAYTSSSGNHYLSPDDVNTIYNVKPLHDAGIDGAGQKIVVAGQTQIDLADVQQFRSRFDLPAGDPQVVLVPNTRDPGKIKDDMVEADLDVEWAGVAAPGAGIVYVYSYDVMDAVKYAIDQNLAPVLSLSYGLCEPQTSASDTLMLQSWARQANAQGMTWLTASGDSGGADCVSGNSHAGAALAVDVPASIPEVTGVGGTEFNEGAGQYWNAGNAASGGSALSYIPEIAWNDSDSSGPSSGGGGASTVFPKPSWQAGGGVPNDNARDVPDVSLAASADHDGYMIYSDGQWQIIGGTSAGAPVMAGVATLLNHYLIASGAQAGAGLGNINPRLYSLAQTTPSIFHDVIEGNNIVEVTCSFRARGCTPGTFGYNAGPGYDQATGLGSIDAYSLVLAWSGQTAATTARAAAVTLASSAAAIASSANVTLTATVRGSNGGTPLGSITFYLGGASLGTATLAGSGGTATASLTITGAELQVGTNTIVAQYEGNTFYTGATASTTVTVTSSSTGAPSITGLANGASFQGAYAPGMILSVFGSALAPSQWAAFTFPLPVRLAGVSVTINGVAAPLYYVSPAQLNVQIPYETPVNATATLVVNNNGATASRTFPVSAAAPGVFVDQNGAPVPHASGAPGQVLTLYVTGAGALSPPVATGSAPPSGTPAAQLPAPLQPVAVTVGRLPAAIRFLGVPAGLAGVTQINYELPATAQPGVQDVVVTIGTASSTPVKLTVAAQ